MLKIWQRLKYFTYNYFKFVYITENQFSCLNSNIKYFGAIFWSPKAAHNHHQCTLKLTIFNNIIIQISLRISQTDFSMNEPNLNFDPKTNLEESRNLSSWSTQTIEESVPLKMLFVASRYLYPLPRYKRSKRSVKTRKRCDPVSLRTRLVTQLCSRKCVRRVEPVLKAADLASGADQRNVARVSVGQWLRARERSDGCEKDSDSGTLKIRHHFEQW